MLIGQAYGTNDVEHTCRRYPSSIALIIGVLVGITGVYLPCACCAESIPPMLFRASDLSV